MVRTVFKNLTSIGAPEHTDQLDNLEKDQVLPHYNERNEGILAAAAAAAAAGAPAAATAPSNEVFPLITVKKAFKKLCSRCFVEYIKEEKQRPDGRGLTEVRPINIEQTYLPGPHGSCLFTRGDTQTFATCTLGDSSQVQKADSLLGQERKRFYLGYR